MAGEEMTKQISGRRRSTRAGSNLIANVNGGVLLLLGAAAGALFASAFAAHRIRAHKRRRGSTTEGIQRDSCENLATHEAKELVVNEEGAGDEANGGEGVVEVNSHENFDASQVGQTEIDFYLLEERKGEVVERNPVTDMELVDGEYGKLTSCIDLSADNCTSLANICGNLEIDSSLGETLLRYDDDKLVGVIVREKSKSSCIINKEDDEEDSKSANKVEWSEREEIEGKYTTSNFYSEQSRLLEESSGKHLHLGEALESIADEEEAGGANTGERRVQGELDIYFDDKVAKRSLAKEYELVDEVEGELAKVGSSPANVYNRLGIDTSVGKVQLRHDDEQLVADIVSKESENPFINRKEDEEDSKKPYIEEGAEREDLEGKITHSNLNMEELCLPEENSVKHLHLGEASESIVDEEEAGGANTGERRVQGEFDIYFDDKVAKRSLAKEYELVNEVEGELAKISSSPANVYNRLGIDTSVGKVQLMHDDEQLVADIVSKEIETPFINRKEDEEDSKKPYIEEGAEREELEGKITHSNLNMEEVCLPVKKACQNLEMVKAIEERKFEDDLVDEMYNSILKFVFSRSMEMEIISPSGDQDEINSLIEDIKPFFGSSGEAKMVLDMTQNDSGKHLIMEDKFVLESGSFKDVLRADILSVEQENENEDRSDEKMVEGSKELCEQTVALPLDSCVTIISEPEENSCKDLIMLMTKEDVQLITHSYGIVHIEDNKMELEQSYSPLDDEGIEGSFDKIQGAKTCIHDNPTLFIMVEENIQLENNILCDLNGAIQKERTEENLPNGFIKNMESSETKENHRKHEECSLTESNTVQFSLEHDNLMAFNESPLIQFQGIEPIEREEKARLEDLLPLSPELNMKIVQPIQEHKLDNCEKTPDSNQEIWTFSDKVEREDEIISVRDNELESRQFIEAHNDNLEREIEYPQILSVVNKGDGEIYEESQAQIEEEEEDCDEEEENLKLSFKLVDNGGKIMAELIDADRENQCQVEGHGSNVSCEGKQQIAVKKVKGIDYMFLLTALAIVFTFLIFLYTKDFISRTTILENFFTG